MKLLLGLFLVLYGLSTLLLFAILAKLLWNEIHPGRIFTKPGLATVLAFAYIVASLLLWIKLMSG